MVQGGYSTTFVSLFIVVCAHIRGREGKTYISKSRTGLGEIEAVAEVAERRAVLVGILVAAGRFGSWVAALWVWLG